MMLCSALILGSTLWFKQPTSTPPPPPPVTSEAEDAMLALFIVCDVRNLHLLPLSYLLQIKNRRHSNLKDKRRDPGKRRLCWLC